MKLLMIIVRNSKISLLVTKWMLIKELKYLERIQMIKPKLIADSKVNKTHQEYLVIKQIKHHLIFLLIYLLRMMLRNI